MAPNNRQGPPQQTEPDFELIESGIVTVGTTINLPTREDFPHNFVGVQFFADAAGLTPVTPGAGTVTITVETVNSLSVFEAPPDNVIDATTPTTVTWDANTRQVKAVPAGITTATHYKLVWTGNRS